MGKEMSEGTRGGRIRAHLRHNVVGYVALFVAVSMTPLPSYAAGLVGTAQLKDGAVTTPKLHNNAVKSGKILDGEVKRIDIANGAINAAKIFDGSVGIAEMASDAVSTAQIVDGSVANADLAPNSVSSSKIGAGQVGTSDLAAGAVQDAELGTIVEVVATSATVANGAEAGITADCPAGSKLIAGGFDSGGGGFQWRVQRSMKFGANGWRVFGTNQTGGNSAINAKAYCLQ